MRKGFRFDVDRVVKNMAEPAAKDCICCKDERPHHGLRLAFTARSSGYCPPAIRTSGVELNKICKIVYQAYFCDFAITQRKEEFFTRGDRRIRYYTHCHCSAPGSLQCQAACAAMCEMSRHLKMRMYDSELMPAPHICCNSWFCCPLKSLGMVVTPEYHFFAFQMAKCGGYGRDFFKMWASVYSVEIIKIHESLCFVFAFCSCDKSFSDCVERCSSFFNCMRVLMSCGYDRFYFGNFAARMHVINED